MPPPATLRLHVPEPALQAQVELDLPAAAATHVKVRRLQPGDTLRLFDGTSGLDWPATLQGITRGAVRVALGDAPLAPPAAELPLAVTLAFCMPANERVDALVEKAAELGAAALVPLMSERSVLRLQGERAERRRAHWQAVAASACEQCGRARVPEVQPVRTLAAWLQAERESGRGPLRLLLSLGAGVPPLAGRGLPVGARTVVLLSGPEGGLTEAEEALAIAAGHAPVSLGARTLRADTAPLAALAWMAVQLAAA